MIGRFVFRSLKEHPRKLLLTCLVLWASSGLITAMFSLLVSVQDKLQEELASIGANIRLLPVESAVGGIFSSHLPQWGYLAEEKIEALKRDIFWRNNLLALSPRLFAEGKLLGKKVPLLGLWFDHKIPLEGGEVFVTGANHLHRHWQLQGSWPKEGKKECLLGWEVQKKFFPKVPSKITLEIRGKKYSFQVTGVVRTFGKEDKYLLLPLDVLQEILHLKGKVHLVDISAVTTPETKIAEKWRRDPTSLTPEEYERWVCTPFPGSVAVQIQNAVPHSTAQVVRPVAESQGKLLNHLKTLILGLSALAFVTGALSVLAIFFYYTLERRGEVALMKALGATPWTIATLFLLESFLLGIFGGALGALSGVALGHWLVAYIFSLSQISWSVLLLGPLFGVFISGVGTSIPLWKSLCEPPSLLLKEAAYD